MPINSFDDYPLSWRPEKEKLKRPYYKSLALDLENRIREGKIKEGALLPPQREIADYLDLDYTTITRVYNLLKKKGLIYGIVGKGTFVSPHAKDDVTIKAEDGSLIELGLINGFSEETKLVEKATKRVVEKGYLKNLYEYSEPLGQLHQREAARAWLKVLCVDADSENIAILSGAQNALAVALISLFSPNDKIAIDEYSYPNFIELAKLIEIILVPVKGDEHGMLAEELDKECLKTEIKGLYLMPCASNPTNVTIPIERRMELKKVIEKRGLILIEDDISSWLRAVDGSSLPSFYNLLGTNSVYIAGTTKSLSPGLRVAYMAFPEILKDRIEHGILNVNIKTSSFDAEIITELILSGDAIKIAKKKKEKLKNAISIYNRYFPNDENEISYYRWLEIRSNKSGKEIEEDLRKLGVRVYHSDRFSVTKSRGRNFLRIALCSARNLENLEKGLRILKDYLEGDSGL